MLSYSVPMSYECLRTVLLHTDPNLRFAIAQRIPKIRLTEKTVPLKIDTFTLGDFKTLINSQSYNLGIYRHYHTEEIPMEIKSDNNDGGVSYDLDQYGLDIPNSSTPILNGDVSFRREHEEDDQMDTEEIEDFYQLSLRRYESALRKINQLELEGITVEEFLAGPMTEDDQHCRCTLRLSKENLQMRINEYRHYLIPFHYRHYNLSPPYTCYIQLTVTQGEVKTIQRYVYNHKLYEAAKKLNEILFGNRPVIIVKQFQCENFDDIWRIPVGFKIAANSVYGESRQIVPISSILDSSRTLAELSINATEEVLNFEHCCVKNTKLLSIRIHKERIGQLAKAFETMENQRILIEWFDNSSADDYYQLLRGWMSPARRIWSGIAFGLKVDQIGEEILELVRNGNEGTESTDRFVIVPLINATKLVVSHTPLSKENNGSKFLLMAQIVLA